MWYRYRFLRLKFRGNQDDGPPLVTACMHSRPRATPTFGTHPTSPSTMTSATVDRFVYLFEKTATYCERVVFKVAERCKKRSHASSSNSGPDHSFKDAPASHQYLHPKLCNNFRAGSTTMNKCERVLHLGVGCASVQELHGLLEVTMIYCLSSVQPPDCSAHLELVHERLEGFGDDEEGFHDSFAGRHLMHAPSSIVGITCIVLPLRLQNRDVHNISNLGITFCKNYLYCHTALAAANSYRSSWVE